MKTPLLLALACCVALCAYAQDKDPKDWKVYMDQVQSSAAQPRVQQRSPINGAPKNTVNLPASLLQNRTALQQLKNLRPDNHFSSASPVINATTARTDAACIETSYSRVLGIENGWLFISSVTKVKDGGVLVVAHVNDTTQSPPNTWDNRAYGVLLKLDEDGNVLWLKKFDELGPGPGFLFILVWAFELSNGDIILTGQWNVDISTNVYKTVVARLTGNGDLIWQNCLQNNVEIFNNAPGTFFYSVEGVADGLNGDVILCGTSISNIGNGKLETVVRLNNQGQVVWDANYGNENYGGAEGVNVFVQNGQIILVGLSHGSGFAAAPPAINFLTLDYNNGNQLSKRFFRPEYTDDMQEFKKSYTYWYNKCVRLSNGHFLFYGKLFSDFMRLDPVNDYFGVVEFDEQFNLLNSYTLTGGIFTNYYNNILHFDPSGKGLVVAPEYTSEFEWDVFYCAFGGGQFQKQRKAHYDNAAVGANSFYTNAVYLNDNGYAHIHSYFENISGVKSLFQFRKMHNSDTASLCLGSDTSVLYFSPLNIIEDPTYVFLDANIPNKIVPYQAAITQTGTTSTSTRNGCLQTNYCDTVKIHGESVICGSATSMLFTTFKNRECGGIVQWNIDNTAVDSMRVLNDSTTRVWFKNINWQGKLYAELPVGACFIPGKDSMAISITRTEEPPALGVDTILCEQTTIELHAGNHFSTYLWQDGSSGTTLTAAAPGIYWVKTGDNCGNNYIDSITILPYSINIDIGPDRTKCNTDTLHLQAANGFLNYQWSNNYNINATNTQQVIVNPQTDTAYYLKAEKMPGCFAYDTVRIVVKSSPAIQLGADKSFCAGDSAVLDAGAGFMQYLWSNGDTRQRVAFHTAGTYSVIATMANECKSYDTFRVMNIWANPVISLNKNPELCTGEIRMLQPGIFASYLWNDGSTVPTYAVTSPGTYYVTVRDNNQCKASDTVRITTMLPVPSHFLPADTAICNYGKLLLKPLNDYPSYIWNTGSTASSVTITQAGIYGLQVTDGNNCKGTDTIVVRAKDCIQGFNIPNAFTPNNDKFNNTFKPIIGGNVTEYRFTIYNRWGQVIFATSDRFKGWDGTVGSSAPETTVFVWTCTYKMDGEPVKRERGTVVLIR